MDCNLGMKDEISAFLPRLVLVNFFFFTAKVSKLRQNIFLLSRNSNIMAENVAY